MQTDVCLQERQIVTVRQIGQGGVHADAAIGGDCRSDSNARALSCGARGTTGRPSPISRSGPKTPTGAFLEGLPRSVWGSSGICQAWAPPSRSGQRCALCQRACASVSRNLRISTSGGHFRAIYDWLLATRNAGMLSTCCFSDPGKAAICNHRFWP